MRVIQKYSNEEVVRCLREKNEAMFDELYTNCYSMVYFQAQKLLNDESEAENVAQEVFLAVYRQVDRLNDPEALRSWIGGIVMRQSMKRFRGRRMEADFESEEVQAELVRRPSTEASPEETLDRQATAEILGELMDQLPAEQRQVITLFYYNECSVKDISEAMECSEGTTKSRLNYARASLRRMVTAREEQDGIRLHAIDPGLFMLAFWMQEKKLSISSQTILAALTQAKEMLGAGAFAGTAAGAASVAGGTAGAVTEAAAAGGSAAAAATAGVFGGLGAKIAAGVAAVILLAGGLGAGKAVLDRQKPDITSEPEAVELLLPDEGTAAKPFEEVFKEPFEEIPDEPAAELLYPVGEDIFPLLSEKELQEMVYAVQPYYNSLWCGSPYDAAYATIITPHDTEWGFDDETCQSFLRISAADVNDYMQKRFGIDYPDDPAINWGNAGPFEFKKDERDYILLSDGIGDYGVSFSRLLSVYYDANGMYLVNYAVEDDREPGVGSEESVWLKNTGTQGEPYYQISYFYTGETTGTEERSELPPGAREIELNS